MVEGVAVVVVVVVVVLVVVVVVVVGSVYVNPFVCVPLNPVSGFVTTTFPAPTVPAGVVAVIDVSEATVTPVAALPLTATVAFDSKPVPVIVIAVPPAVLPLAGDVEMLAGWPKSFA